MGSSKDTRDNGDPFFDIIETGVDIKFTIPRLFSPFYTENIIPKYMSPSTRISLASTSQTNIGLDKETLSATLNYKWYPNAKKTNGLDLFNIQYVRNLNIDNYFKVYDTSYQLLNETAQEVNYIGPNEELSIPDGTDEFLEYALNEETPPEISDDELTTINGINERKERLTENNLILSSSFSFTKDGRTNIFDNDFR